MNTWLLPANVNKNSKYHYEIDRALENLKTIFWAQSTPLKNIAVGEIVYIYESSPVQAVGWKCKVLAVRASYEATKEIDDSEFEHGDGGISDFYIKITALAKYEGESRKKLAYRELRKNGLTTKMQSPIRAKDNLLEYINSVAPSVNYDE